VTFDVQAAVREFNTARDRRFEVASRFPTGLQGGAWLLREPGSGTLAVVKPVTGDTDRLATIIKGVRAAGWPTPAWLGHGQGWYVQEHVDGVPARPLTPDRLRTAMDALERQRGLAAGPLWTDRLDPDALRRPVYDLGQVGRELIVRLDRLSEPGGPAALPVDDLVHGDFNTCNILVRPDGSVRLIDVEGVGAGTRVIDYAALLREAYVEGYGTDVTRTVLHAGRSVAGPTVLATCAALAAYFIVGFKLRHEPHRIAEILARLHAMAADLAAPE
jgi:hypothetical protein